MTIKSEVLAIRDQGIEGDRYSTGKGHYSGDKVWDAHLTLIEEEPFIELRKSHGIILDPKELRRNILVKGVDLASLIDREFYIGLEVVCKARKIWPPCSHIVNFTKRTEIFQYLARDCGIGVDIIRGGVIRLGDRIKLIPLS